jgi:diaminopimelate epimerase
MMRGLRFYKMSGSGNDFVVVDARKGAAEKLTAESAIRALCARGTGIGADGLVLLEPSPGVDFRMAYYNADGSRASMCGNAALCCTRLAIELGAPTNRDLVFETDAGQMKGRVRDGQPEIDLTAVREVQESIDIAPQSGEDRMGFAIAGVPHLVVLCQDVERVDVETRGRVLRSHPKVMPQGANANFVSRDKAAAGWRMRTFERGVEGETLACGTGAVATAVLLSQWGLANGPVGLRTRSGRTLTVRFDTTGGNWMPSLAGEGRIVFEGLGRELEPASDS